MTFPGEMMLFFFGMMWNFRSDNPSAKSSDFRITPAKLLHTVGITVYPFRGAQGKQFDVELLL